MRRGVRLAVAGAVAGALTMTAAAPAGAQEPLGFQIDTTEGLAGDVVTGQVNTADVAQHCNADAGELQARFDATQLALQDLVDVYLPGASFDGIAVIIDEPITIESLDELTESVVAYGSTFTVAQQVSADPDLAAEAFPQTFLMTFADISTQEPVGERGNFDPATGEGSVVVPDLDPGLWAVAAACVSPSTDPGTLQDAVSTNSALVAPFVEQVINSQGFQQDWEALTGEPFGFPLTIPDETAPEFLIFFLALSAALEFQDQLVPAMVEPDALGVQLFNILADPRELIADVIADIDGLVADGELKTGQARGLSRPLHNATRSLDGDKIGPACSQLADFVAEANQKVADGALSPAAAADLIAQVEAIQAQLDCG